MNRRFFCTAGLLFMWSLFVTTPDVEARPIIYEVLFKGNLVATQTLTIAESAEARTVTTSFRLEVPVFVAQHRIAETLSVSYDGSGMVTGIRADIADGAKRSEIVGTTGSDGMLRVIRTGPDGVTTNYIARADYDFNSLTMYGNAPTNFLPTNSTVRVLDIAQGKVVPVTLSVIGESYTTRERQDVPATHVVWSEGAFVSHSWHPERFSNLPVRYIRQNDLGEFTFSLQR